MYELSAKNDRLTLSSGKGAYRTAREIASSQRLRFTASVTEQTFDAYLYQLVESKQKFISQIMTSKSPVRSGRRCGRGSSFLCGGQDALPQATSVLRKKMDLDIQVSKLKVLKQSYLSEHYDLEDRMLKYFPQNS
ncbi:MAG: hypothetical protein ACLUTU_09465 [Blautia faecis]